MKKDRVESSPLADANGDNARSGNMKQNKNLLWSGPGGLTCKERDEELRGAQHEVRRALADKRRQWADDDLIEEADAEDVAAAARLLAGARCFWHGFTFTEDDCVPSNEWEPRYYRASKAMNLLVALGFLTCWGEDEDGMVRYELCEE
jgi:hypothetical protein